MLLVNGIPLVVIEAKTPVRASQSWVDGALQMHDDYERNVPELFVANVLSRRHRGQGVPLRLRSGCRSSSGGRGASRTNDALPATWRRSRSAVAALLRPARAARPPRQLHAYATDKKKRRIKIIARYQQYEGANKIVERVVAGKPSKGLHLALPGLGQVAADALRGAEAAPASGAQEPDRASSWSTASTSTPRSASTFYAADMPEPGEGRESRRSCSGCSRRTSRKIIITTIFKFGEADGVLNDRGNIIAMVDEAHRTQEGDLGRRCARRCRTPSCSA